MIGRYGGIRGTIVQFTDPKIRMRSQILAQMSCFAFVVIAATACVAEEKKPESDVDSLLKSLQGEWVLESMEMAGQKRKGDDLPARFRGMRQSIKGDQMIVVRADGKAYECKVHVRSTKDAKQLDIVMNDGQSKSRTAKCIYKISDGKLILAEGRTTRPTSFDTAPGNPTKVSTFTRKR